MNFDECANYIVRKLNDNGYEAYIVGGCIRDTLMGRIPNDWDICTSARPEYVYKLFGDLGFTVVDTGFKYGTVSVLMSEADIELVEQTDNKKYTMNEMEPSIYEITTFRKVSGTRHPENIEFSDNVEDDIYRRDFTMNAIMYNPETWFTDLTGGMQDINDRLIRCIENPAIRLEEDPLRILRAIRFEAQLGFRLEENTEKQIYELVRNNITLTLSQERIQTELFKLISGDYASKCLSRHREIIGIIIPELKNCIGFDQNNPNHKFDVYEHTIETIGMLEKQGIADTRLKMAALLHDIGKPSTASTGVDGITHFYNHANVGALIAEKILRRLNCTNETIKEIANLVKYHDYMPDSKSAMKRLINKIGNTTTDKLLSLKHADMLAQAPYNMDVKIGRLRQAREWLTEIEAKHEEFRLQDLEINGKDLIRLGYQPGMLFSVILNELFNLVLDDKIPNTHDRLVDYVVSHY